MNLRHVAAIATAAGLLVTPAADAKIKPVKRTTKGATQLAKTIASNPSQVRRAIFSVVPPRGVPAAWSSTRLTGFPRAGGAFGILTNGDARDADNRNTSEQLSTANLGPIVRGARDTTILRIYLRVPRKANCLSIRFRFLSEEYPEFVNDIFNDAFIAELDESNWDASGPADPSITAPNNFATTADGRPIRVNQTEAKVTRKNARGTTYDAATRMLRASTPVTPGGHSLYLSIFDQGDRQYDSAVFLDRLTLTRAKSCESGAVFDS